MNDQPAILALLAAEQAALEKIAHCQQQAESILKEAYTKVRSLEQQTQARSQRWLYASYLQDVQKLQEKYKQAQQALLGAHPENLLLTEASPQVQAFLQQVVGAWFDATLS